MSTTPIMLRETVLCGVQEGWMCQKRNGKWARVEKVTYFPHERETDYTIDGAAYKVTGKKRYVMFHPHPDDIIHVEFPGKYRSHIWARHAMLLGNKVWRPAWNLFEYYYMDGDRVKYNTSTVQKDTIDEWTTAMAEAGDADYGWQIYCPEADPEELLVGAEIGDRVIVFDEQDGTSTIKTIEYMHGQYCIINHRSHGPSGYSSCGRYRASLLDPHLIKAKVSIEGLVSAGTGDSEVRITTNQHSYVLSLDDLDESERAQIILLRNQQKKRTNDLQNFNRNEYRNGMDS